MIGMDASRDDSETKSTNARQKPQEQFESSLQLILQLLCDCLSLQSKNQAAALLAQESQYLKHACCKGLKGQNFRPIVAWYQAMLSYQD